MALLSTPLLYYLMDIIHKILYQYLSNPKLYSYIIHNSIVQIYSVNYSHALLT